MFHDLPLESAPRLVWVGLGVHGHTPIEKYLLPEAWCLHLYRDPMDLRVSGQKIEVVPGTATLIPPNAPIEFRFARRIHHVHAFVHFVAAPGRSARVAGVQHLGDTFDARFAQLSEAIGFWSNESARATARVWELLWALSEPSPSLDEDTLVRRARERIELSLGEALSVAALARELNVSHNHLTRRFKAETGQTVVEFIRARRVERAVYLLRNTTLPIKAVARACGLGDFHSFNKVLRAQTGQSPRALRGR